MLLVLHTGQVHHDGVALTQNLRLGHAETVDAIANLLDGELHARGRAVGARHGALGDRHTALQVEAERWLGVGEQRGDQAAVGEHNDAHQRDEEFAAHEVAQDSSAASDDDTSSILV